MSDKLERIFVFATACSSRPKTPADRQVCGGIDALGVHVLMREWSLILLIALCFPAGSIDAATPTGIGECAVENTPAEVAVVDREGVVKAAALFLISPFLTLRGSSSAAKVAGGGDLVVLPHVGFALDALRPPCVW